MANNFSNGNYDNLCNYDNKNSNKSKILENNKKETSLKIYSDNFDQEIKSDIKTIFSYKNNFQTNNKIFSSNSQNNMTPPFIKYPFFQVSDYHQSSVMNMILQNSYIFYSNTTSMTKPYNDYMSAYQSQNKFYNNYLLFDMLIESSQVLDVSKDIINIHEIKQKNFDIMNNKLV